jgi:hypothetical protein
MSDLEAGQLRELLPGLSDEYLTIAQTWQLEGISIGYLTLSPPSFAQARCLVDVLTTANGPINPGFETLQLFQVLEIASWDGDPVCLGSRFTARTGQVFRFSSVDDSPYPRLLAATVEDLLKAATELHAFSLSGHGPDPIHDLLLNIGTYLPATAVEEWRILASMVVD